MQIVVSRKIKRSRGRDTRKERCRRRRRRTTRKKKVRYIRMNDGRMGEEKE